MTFGWFSRKAIDGWSRSMGYDNSFGYRNSIAHRHASRRAGSELRHISRPPSRSVQAKCAVGSTNARAHAGCAPQARQSYTGEGLHRCDVLGTCHAYCSTAACKRVAFLVLPSAAIILASRIIHARALQPWS